MNKFYSGSAEMPLQYLRIVVLRRVLRVFSVVSIGLAMQPPLFRAQQRVSIAEEIEWTWEVRPQITDPKLPNVLLLGDSITRSYFPQVTKDLNGVANVYLMASSTSVGDPRLPNQIAEFAALQCVSFAVVHFNNGLHGWGYTEEQFQSGFPIFLQAVRALPGHAQLIWTTITAVKPEASNGATNPRIDLRNAIARAFVEAEKIPIDDLHTLMAQHPGLYEDPFHFNKVGAAIMGDQAAALIKRALEGTAHLQSDQH
jgi:lysophospholipase L1-like esterase